MAAAARGSTADVRAQRPDVLDEQSDPGWSTIDLAAVAASPVPIQLSHASASRPGFASVIRALAAGIPHSEVVELPGAGHVPHVTHPELFAQSLTSSSPTTR